MRGEHPLVLLSDGAGNQVRFFHDSQGFLESILDSAGRLIKIRTDWLGRILQILGPHPETAEKDLVLMSYRFDDNGDLVEARDALGQPWQFVYRHHLLVQ